MNWVDRLNNSNKAFLEIILPKIKKYVGDGIYKPVEIIQDDIAKDLDTLCGIDIWHVIDGVGCRGIASRIQFTEKNWGTFTVRKSRASGHITEYDKRILAIKTGQFIYPYFTCQAYIYNNRFIGGSLAKTIDIFTAIEQYKFTTRINPMDKTEFIAIKFLDVKDSIILEEE